MSVILNRRFSKADTEVTEQGQIFIDLITPNLAAWTALFPWMDATWLADFQADVDAADAYPSDDSVLMDIKVRTGDVASAMAQGRGALGELDAYARLAWPTDRARQRVFGQDRWTENNRNTLRLKESLELAHSKADHADFKPGLLAKGYTQPRIDALLTLAESIETKNRLQEGLKVGRSVNSHDRIALMNILWGQIGTVNICADVVHADDEDRRNQFRLYPAQSVPALTTLIVHVLRAADSTPVVGATVLLSVEGVDPRLTNVEGTATFESSAIPELIDVKVSDPVLGEFNYTDQALAVGEANTLSYSI